MFALTCCLTAHMGLGLVAAVCRKDQGACISFSESDVLPLQSQPCLQGVCSPYTSKLHKSCNVDAMLSMT